MRGHTHLLFAALFGALYLQVYGITSIWSKLTFFGCLLLGSLFPDIDQENSFISQKAVITSKIVTSLTKHRGIFHAIWFPLILTGAALKFTQYKTILFGLSLGYASHLASDALTPHGIAPLHPLKFNIKGPIKTGSIFETLIAIAIIVYFIIRL